MDDIGGADFDEGNLSNAVEQLEDETRLFFAQRAANIFGGWTSELEQALDRLFRISKQQVKKLKDIVEKIPVDDFEEEVEGKDMKDLKSPFANLFEDLNIQAAKPESEMQEADHERTITKLDHGDGGAQICLIYAWNKPDEAISGTGFIADVDQIDGGIIILTAAHCGCEYHPEKPKTFEHARIIIPFYDEDWDMDTDKEPLVYEINRENIHVHHDYQRRPTDIEGYDLCAFVIRDPPEEFLKLRRNKIQVAKEGKDSNIAVSGYFGNDFIPYYSEASGYDIWRKSNTNSLLIYQNPTNPGMSGGPVFQGGSAVIGVHVARNRGSAITDDVMDWIERIAQQPEHYCPANYGELRRTVNIYCRGGKFGEQKFGHISRWNVSSIDNMKELFKDKEYFNEDLTGWDTSSVKNMENMFKCAKKFNGDVSLWDTSAVTTMWGMFSEAKAFNGDLSGWDTSSVKHMTQMFYRATSFNGDLSEWNTKSVTNMSEMFRDAKAFNGGDISRWDTSSVTDMSTMFQGAESFNGEVRHWNTSKVKQMGRMFNGAKSFNADVSLWDTSSVRHMACMFQQAIAFNGDLSQWNASSVTNMDRMFSGATSFNADISLWDTSSVTNMDSMFYCASAFETDISQWDTSSITRLRTYQMFDKATAFKKKFPNFRFSKK